MDVSAQNERLARAAVAAINETYRSNDVGAWRRHVEEWFDPAIVLEAPTDAFIEGEWRGHDGVVDFVANQMEVLRDMWLRMDELVEVDRDCLIVGVSFGGRARHSGLDVEMTPFYVIRMRGGKAVRWQIFQRRDQALEAARQPPHS